MSALYENSPLYNLPGYIGESVTMNMHQMFTSVYLYLLRSTPDIGKWLSDIEYCSTDKNIIYENVRKNCDFVVDIQETTKLYDLLRRDLNILAKKSQSEPNMVEMLNDFYSKTTEAEMQNQTTTFNGITINLPGIVVQKNKKMNLGQLPICKIGNNFITFSPSDENFYFYVPEYRSMTKFRVSFRYDTFKSNEEDAEETQFLGNMEYGFYVDTMSYYLNLEDTSSAIVEAGIRWHYSPTILFRIYYHNNEVNCAITNKLDSSEYFTKECNFCIRKDDGTAVPLFWNHTM